MIQRLLFLNPRWCLVVMMLGASWSVVLGEPSQQTKAMAALLREVVGKSNPMKAPYLLNEQRAAIRFQQRARALALPNGDRRKMGFVLNTQFSYSQELLHAGKNEAAVQEFIKLDQTFDALGFDYSDPNKKGVIHNLAMSYLRLGEQENCLDQHSSDSCFLPIKEGGIHQHERGSKGAIEHLSELLNEFPDDLRARWLFNIAHMTLGTYPDAVPERWRIAPEVFESEASLPVFSDIAGHTGLAITGLSGGSITEDSTVTVC